MCWVACMREDWRLSITWVKRWERGERRDSLWEGREGEGSDSFDRTCVGLGSSGEALWGDVEK